MSLRDISDHMEKVYGSAISAATIGEITDLIIPVINDWQSRPPDEMYCMLWMDSMFYKVKTMAM